MGIFDKLFNRTESKKNQDKKEVQQINNDLSIKHKEERKLYQTVFEMYYSSSCQCAFPRFQQIVGIDCAKSGNSFKCFDTELLIGFSKPYFHIDKSELADENVNEKWICKKCGSNYEFGWQDFSIAVEREKLRLTELKVEQIGKPAITPIPLYIGLMGHSYPPKTEIASVDFAEFERYLTEKY